MARSFLSRLRGARPVYLPEDLTSYPPYRQALWYLDDREMRTLTDIAVEQELDPSHIFFRKGIFGRWKSIQDWQMDTLLNHGLDRHHDFLDVGCGPVRLSLRLVDYLDDDRYCGIDALDSYIELGRDFLDTVLKTDKKYHLLASRRFEFGRFGRKFDFAMAQSVFTHLSFAQIEECFEALRTVMKENGVFLWTIILGKEDKEEPFLYDSCEPMIRTVHRDLSFYRALSQRYQFEFQFLGQAGHPSQQVCLARFKGP